MHGGLSQLVWCLRKAARMALKTLAQEAHPEQSVREYEIIKHCPVVGINTTGRYIYETKTSTATIQQYRFLFLHFAAWSQGTVGALMPNLLPSHLRVSFRDAYQIQTSRGNSDELDPRHQMERSDLQELGEFCNTLSSVSIICYQITL